MIPTIWDSGKGKTMETVDARAWREEGWTGMTRIWGAVKLLCVMLPWWIHLSQPTDRMTARVSPVSIIPQFKKGKKRIKHNVNYGLWVMTRCQCRLWQVCPSGHPPLLIVTEALRVGTAKVLHGNSALRTGNLKLPPKIKFINFLKITYKGERGCRPPQTHLTQTFRYIPRQHVGGLS